MAKTFLDAKEKGLTRFFTGEPCRRGHVAERYTSNQCCVQCAKENRRGKRLVEGRNRYAKHREKVLKSAYRSKLKKRYGITPEQYEALLAAQNGQCAICGSKPKDGSNGKRLRLCLDHSHENGMVRGLLCNACNAGLGHFADNPDNLAAAIRYLADNPVLAAEVLGALMDGERMAA